jgi:predicted MarR family transcription regulator
MNSDITRELAEIAKINGNLLKPADVVEFARSPKTALHSQFEWDDELAGHAYRLWQARQLISIQYKSVKDINTRVYVSLSTDRGESGYRPIEAVVRHAPWREQMLADALAELSVFRRKYALLKELAELFDAMDKLKGKVKR